MQVSVGMPCVQSALEDIKGAVDDTYLSAYAKLCVDIAQVRHSRPSSLLSRRPLLYCSGFWVMQRNTRTPGIAA